jgi:hypothetical protein
MLRYFREAIGVAVRLVRPETRTQTMQIFGFLDEPRCPRSGRIGEKFLDGIEGNGRYYLGEDSGDEIPKIFLQILRDFGGDLRGGVREQPARVKTAKE